MDTQTLEMLPPGTRVLRSPAIDQALEEIRVEKAAHIKTVALNAAMRRLATGVQFQAFARALAYSGPSDEILLACGRVLDVNFHEDFDLGFEDVHNVIEALSKLSPEDRAVISVHVFGEYAGHDLQIALEAISSEKHSSGALFRGETKLGS